ncbi:MAG: acetate--CoA ligase family protein, partial [Methyloligellaceae bacterium]
MTIRNLEYALDPGSLALIGASPRPGSVGATLMRNIREGGFGGPIRLVNPRHSEIDGLACYPDVAALPEAPDLAVIATPPDVVPGLLGDLGSRGTGAALVITAGFGSENGLRQAILDAAQPTCLRIVGPNCLGLFVPRIGLNASFAHLAPADGKLAFLSQSGALVGAVLEWAASRKIGFSYVVSMGDMTDVDVGDLLDYLAGDIHTRAILLYLETVPNPRKFMSAARSAARAKPVVIVKSGRHAASAKAAATHTGALAGSDGVADAAFRRAGLLRVHELEELFIAAEALTRQKPLAGDRLTILTNGGGAGVLAVDRLMDSDGRLAQLGDETLAALDGTLPDTWSRSNPIDIIGDAGPERYEAALHAVLDDADGDAVLVMNCPTALTSS